MTDELDDRLRRLDGPRPLPPELRARLERALLAGDELGADIALTDSARPLDPGARQRLEAVLLAEPGEGNPVALPPRMRRRLEQRMAGRTGPAVQRLLAVAVVIALCGAVAIVGLRARPRQVASRASKTGLGRAASAGSGGSTAGGRPFSADAAQGPPPPYALQPAGAPQPSGSAAGAPTPAARGAAAPAIPLRVAIVPGDADQEAGFRAYVDLLNHAGGAGGHPIEVVSATASRPAPDVVATVNLGADPLASASGPPPWVTAPLLETMTVPEVALAGRVFSMASVVEHQAHLAVAEAFPAPSPGAVAVIYAPSHGLYASRVAPALEAALRARKVTVRRQVTDPGRPISFQDRGAAFVALPPSEVTRWVGAAHARRYAPPSVWGLAGMLDERLVPDLPARTTVVSPYRLLEGDEADAVRRAAGRPSLDVGLIHGWVTAKWLAVAIWSGHAQTADEVAAALVASAGYDSGWAPPYEVRPGTQSRTPEAADLTTSGVTFVSGPFRRDP